MYQDLYSELQQVTEESGQVLITVDDIFNALVNEELNLLPSLNTMQTDGLQKVKKKKARLRSLVEKMANQHNINDFRIQSILHLLEQYQKENILELIKSLMEVEQRLEVSFHRNKDYLAVLMSVSEDKIDKIVYLNQKEKQQNVFLNKKF